MVFGVHFLWKIAKALLDLNEGRGMKKYMEEKEEEFEDLTEWLKDVYGDKVSKVVLSNRLEDTPMIIVTTKYGYSANMERIAKGQAFGSKNPQKATKILELNFRHPVILGLKEMVSEDSDSANNFAARVDRIVRNGLGVEADAEVEPLPEFDDDEESEDSDDDDDEDYDEEEDLDEDEKEEL